MDTGGRFVMKAARVLSHLVANHHNRIQFLGYEVANVVLVIHEALQGGTTPFGLTYEIYAALSLLVGSACIWRFDFESRPSMLYFGGMALTIGGLFLAAAGYTITGFAVTLASLETARGGLQILRNYVAEELSANRIVAPSMHNKLNFAAVSLCWYVLPINYVTSHFQRLGEFINERPFLTGTFIKAPMRLEFVGKKLVEGDMIGAAVGLSWMILGDGGLAFNDAKLKAFLIEHSRSVGGEFQLKPRRGDRTSLDSGTATGTR